MFIALFQVLNKNKKFCFFQKTFLWAEISMNITFGIFFLTLSHVKVNFHNRQLMWRLYITIKSILTTRWVELVVKKNFVAAFFNLEDEIFVVHIAFLDISDTNKIPLFNRTQIISLKVNEVATVVSVKYSNFADVFFLELPAKLSKYTKINNQIINFVDTK